MGKFINIWSVSRHDESALEKINKNSKDNTLYLNCTCEFSINGKKEMRLPYDSCLYSKDSGIIIFFENVISNEEEIIKKLDEKGIKYTTTILENTMKLPEEYYPTFWFVQGKRELENAIDDSLKNSQSQCYLYKNISIDLTLGHTLNGQKICDIKEELWTEGLFFPDKLIFALRSKEDKQTNVQEIINMLEEKRIIYKKEVIPRKK